MDWDSFTRGVVVGLTAWAIWTVVKDGWTQIDSEPFDVFDDDDESPSWQGKEDPLWFTTATIRRTPRSW